MCNKKRAIVHPVESKSIGSDEPSNHQPLNNNLPGEDNLHNNQPLNQQTREQQGSAQSISHPTPNQPIISDPPSYGLRKPVEADRSTAHPLTTMSSSKGQEEPKPVAKKEDDDDEVPDLPTNINTERRGSALYGSFQRSESSISLSARFTSMGLDNLECELCTKPLSKQEKNCYLLEACPCKKTHLFHKTCLENDMVQKALVEFLHTGLLPKTYELKCKQRAKK